MARKYEFISVFMFYLRAYVPIINEIPFKNSLQIEIGLPELFRKQFIVILYKPIPGPL